MELEQVLAFLRPDETARDFFLRRQMEKVYTGVCAIDAHVCLRPGVVIELAGGSGSGKSTCLIQAAATCLLQHQALGEASMLGGHVIYLDMDGKFEPLKLLQVLQHQVNLLSSGHLPDAPQASHQDKKQLFEHCLSRFHLITCHSSFELLACLSNISNLLQLLKDHGGCRLLLIDQVGAFFWQDKACKTSLTAGVPASVAAEPAISLLRVSSGITSYLEAITKKHRVPVLATKYTSVVIDDNQSNPALLQKEYMPTAWQEVVTHRLVLCASPAHTAVRLPNLNNTATHILTQWQDARKQEPVMPLYLLDVGVLDGNIDVA